MSQRNDTNPIDLDLTVQMQNDRLAFQYSSIVKQTTGEDLLQNVLSSNSTISDTQVEIAIDTNDIYTTNGTNSNISNVLSQSYSLILPNTYSLSDTNAGILVFQHDSAYVTNKQSLESDDVFQQNTRTRYPSKSLKGSFMNLEDITTNNSVIHDIQDNITQLDSRVSQLESEPEYWRSTDESTPNVQVDIIYGNATSSSPGNVTVRSQLRVNRGYFGTNYDNVSISDPNLNAVATQADLVVNGQLASSEIISGSYITLSDARLKTNIVPIENILSGLTSIQPVSYDWKHKISKREFGFIAQNVQTIYPQLVHPIKSDLSPTTDNVLTVNYIGFIPLLTSAIQEQQSIIHSLKQDIQKLQAQMKQLTPKSV